MFETRRFHSLDVFTDAIFGGNPLAVLPDASGLSDQQMQAIASEFNLSETVFILPPRDLSNVCALKIFTPKVELPFAGHPTVGAAHLLASLGRLPDALVHGFEVKAGLAAIRLHGAPENLEVEIDAPVLPAPVEVHLDAGMVAATLGLGEDDIHPLFPVAAFSCGVPFLFVPLRDSVTLARAGLDVAAWRTHLSGCGAPHVYVFAELSPGTFRARMFAPASGIDEDPATGGAAVAFVGYLAAAQAAGTCRDGEASWCIEQGVEMGRPSLLIIRAEFHAGRVTRSSVSGRAVPVMEGTIRIPLGGEMAGSGAHRS